MDGLKKGDFTVLEDGKPQAIQVFEFQKLEQAKLPELPPPPPLAANIIPMRKVETIQAPAAGQIQSARQAPALPLFRYVVHGRRGADPGAGRSAEIYRPADDLL